MKNTTFRNANEAYEYLHNKILLEGVPFDNTKALFNVGFYITDPMDNKIINKERNWKQDYAEAEWQWYLSGDRSIYKLEDIYGKVPEIWKRSCLFCYVYIHILVINWFVQIFIRLSIYFVPVLFL